MASDQRGDERLLQPDELGAVALQLLSAGADGAQGLALVDDAANLLLSDSTVGSAMTVAFIAGVETEPGRIS